MAKHTIALEPSTQNPFYRSFGFIGKIGFRGFENERVLFKRRKIKGLKNIRAIT